jgi:hypothetical protein
MGTLKRVAVGAALLALTTTARAHAPGDPFGWPGNDPSTLERPLEPSARCLACHQAAAPSVGGQWAAGAHAGAAIDPVFRAAVTLANQDLVDSGNFCWRCHAPAGWLAGRAMPADGSALTPEDLEGVTCAFCHRLERGDDRVVDPGPLVGNGGWYLVDEKVYLGPRAAAFSPVDAHRARASDWLADSAACAGCHSLRNPIQPFIDPADPEGALLGPYFPLIQTYEEWALSDWPERRIGCLDCHAPPGAVRTSAGDDAPLRGDVRDHTLAGGNPRLLDLLDAVRPGAPGERAAARERTLERLQSAATVRFLDLPAVVAPGAPLAFRVHVENRTGHKLPTGWPEGRRMFLEVTAALGDAPPFFTSDAGPDDPQARTYEVRLARTDGGPEAYALRADVIVSDTRIPPAGLAPLPEQAPVGRDYTDPATGRMRAYDAAPYTLDLPAAAPENGPLRLVARLLYEPVTPAYAARLAAENLLDDRGVALLAALDAAPEGVFEVARVEARRVLAGTPPEVERCNALDDDQDGAVDEAPVPEDEFTCGVGLCQRSLRACGPEGLRGEDDCRPGPPGFEACNGLDDDCDGRTDEDQPTARCGVGACGRVAETCRFGVVAGPCVPGAPAPPEAEICNGLDDDCDAATDEGQGEVRCGVGACAVQGPACVDGVERPCTPAAAEGPEVCNGLDDDCDGATDEALPPVQCALGACAFVLPGCVDGRPPRCEDGAPDSPEICNGLDDDCDAAVDEATGELHCGVGACARVAPACVDAAPGACSPGAPAPEICNGVDDDCDDRTDEDQPGVLCGFGECTALLEPGCVDGAPAPCPEAVGAPDRCNGLDDDCDGAVDEALGERTCGEGACRQRTPFCVDGRPSLCTPLPAAMDEACNGEDDDCDGRTDEGACRPPPDAAGVPEADAAPLFADAVIEDARLADAALADAALDVPEADATPAPIDAAPGTPDASAPSAVDASPDAHAPDRPDAAAPSPPRAASGCTAAPAVTGAIGPLWLLAFGLLSAGLRSRPLLAGRMGSRKARWTVRRRPPPPPSWSSQTACP